MLKTESGITTSVKPEPMKASKSIAVADESIVNEPVQVDPFVATPAITW